MCGAFLTTLSVYSTHEAIFPHFSISLQAHFPPRAMLCCPRRPGLRSPPCLRKVLRCLPSARALIVIYNHGRAPWWGANTFGLMKVADGFPRDPSDVLCRNITFTVFERLVIEAGATHKGWFLGPGSVSLPLHILRITWIRSNFSPPWKKRCTFSS